MNSVHTEPGGIFGNVAFQPEIFPGYYVFDITLSFQMHIKYRRKEGSVWNIHSVLIWILFIS